MTDQQQRKQHIRNFLRTPVWTDEKLCALLAHAESILSFNSCCCLIGVATADHALKGKTDSWWAPHYHLAQDLPLAPDAHHAFCSLPEFPSLPDADVIRNRILRPIIKAELRRREISRRVAVELDARGVLLLS